MESSSATELSGLNFYARLSRLGISNYRAKIMLMAFIGTHVPLITLSIFLALQSSHDWPTLLKTIGITLAATLIGTAVTLWVLNELLQPVLLTSRALRGYRESRRRDPLPSDFTDEVGTLMGDAKATLDHLDATLDALEHIDEVTALPNRKRFLHRVESRVARGDAFAVAVLHFGNFTRIAEALDTGPANAAMRELVERIASRPEFGHSLARVGPAYLACIIGAVGTDAQRWVDAAGRLRETLNACAQDIMIDGMAVKPVLHGGMATFPEDGIDVESLLDHAINAAAQALDTAPVVLHSAEARRSAVERFKLEQELRRALANEEFELHYQPVVDVFASRVVGAEALIRWRHPQRGLLAPAHFIGTAETSGLIEPIGLWVLRQACAQVRKWNRSGAKAMRVAVNLSARQFMDPKLTTYVLEAIADHGISANQLEIELTETAAMVDHEHTRRVFTALRDAGVGIAIDDFGTGYASMSYLRRLPFDKLKIDREFVANVDTTHHNQAICGALIELSKGLGLKVLAEGAETEQEVRYLRERGCGLFQGYYFARPMPADDFMFTLDGRRAAIETLVTRPAVLA